MQKTILLVGTLDTKSIEFAYVRDLIHERGYKTILLDAGILSEPSLKPDISAVEVAKSGGADLDELRKNLDRFKALEIMIAGVRIIVPQLYAKGMIHAVLGLGGGTGTSIATAGMRTLPVGVPKIMVSSVASADVSPYVDIKDITMMHSVVDVAGLNPLSRRILANAVGAVCGMVEQKHSDYKDKPLIAASMFGITTPCVTEVRRRLEDAGYEVVVFHANGKGGRAMEELIDSGFIGGVADITTTEWADEVVGGDLTAGPDRLGAAARRGIPQVVSCGALDVANFRLTKSIPEKFKDRIFFRHHPNVTLMRTTLAECREIGKRIADKLNQAIGPVILILPLKGISMLDKEGQPLFDAGADKALFDTLKLSVNSNVKVLEFDLHINDPEFADIIADQLLSLLNKS
jgi:uncharacterized protein (UPF0261 family)